ncbi:metal-sulfur cluster assembly factor [Lentilactobacillus kefiri]|uniref:Aromatic ring hydroxylating protein n=2 Tax=Lentilactobacillus kefiri TaxID=33962 RepID=A0A511DS20_LENKE|nr:metal-sulfur cluster assembly factor [Lentilactobacillus kefiri]MCJ2161580.1 metal-sulfur cluster assembly factor [Lentilactobacillus kefiri]MCP9368169.1 metal-sulfur cluster assembly factor [Lentilactobacillus kefiri]MDH5108235.1 metal-sulfur cluster assembly factor [Lentilactobacillus kefiri]MDM7492637.1 metal-sulfur cluster assembly factor [Lentilactobacillus kefiri]PAK59895.1 aromatic ring hydroxylase [Lentilactobacillus kefiri]
MSTERSFKEQAMSVLEDVVDPELAVDIVNLVLIYNVELDNQGLCTVTMTLTIAGCPLTEYLNAAIEEELLAMDQVKKVKINLVWEPAWSIDKMSREAKLDLGIH